MLASYKRQSSIAAGIWLALLLLFIVVGVLRGNSADDANFRGIVRFLYVGIAVVGTSAFWISCWALAKAKGYSGLVGIVLPIFSIVGLIILLSLRDKHPQVPSSQETVANSIVTKVRSVKWLNGRARLSIFLAVCWLITLAAYASYEALSNPEGWLEAKPTENRVFFYSLGVEGRSFTVDGVWFVGRPDRTIEYLEKKAREVRPDLFTNRRPRINWQAKVSRPTFYYKWIFDSTKFTKWAIAGSVLIALAAFAFTVGIQWVSAGFRLAPANGMEAFIFSVYGNPPPPKTAKPEEAAQIAYEELLMKLVDKEEVAKLTTELSSGPMPYSTHDLALSTALNFFKRPELVPRLFNAQLFARMKAMEWLEQGRVVQALVSSFEEVLYKLYKPKV